MAFSEEVSEPRIVYGGTTIYLPRPQRFKHKQAADLRTNRATSGTRETLFLHEYDKISISWKLLPLAYVAELRLLWAATRAGEAFTFTRHWQLSTAYPNNSTPVHKNIWNVKWAVGFDDFPVDLSEDVKDNYDMALEMEEAI